MAESSVIFSADVKFDSSQIMRRVREIERSTQLNFSVNDRAILQPLGRIRTGVDQINSSLDAANQRVITFGASAIVLGSVARSFNEILTSTRKVEKAFLDINSVFNLTQDQLNAFSKDVFNVARKTALSIDVVSKAAAEFARQGLGVEETSKRLESALTLSRLSGLEAGKSVEALTAAINGFSRENLKASEILNKLIAVDTKFAVSSADLAEALSRVGSTAQEAGVSFDELIGLVASAQQITSRGGSVIGNSLKTIFTRISRPETLEQLKAFGIEVEDLEGKTLSATKILKNLGTNLSSLTDEQRKYIVELSAGVYQVNQLNAILGDLGRSYNSVEEATRAAASATNEAEKRNLALNKSLDAQVQNFKTSLTELGAIIGDFTLKPIIETAFSNDVAAGIASAIRNSNVDDSMQTLGGEAAEGLLNGIKNVVTGPGLVAAIAAVVNIIRRTGTLIKEDLSGLVFRRGDESDAIKGINSLLTTASIKDKERLATATSIAEKERIILEILAKQNVLRAAQANTDLSIAKGIQKRSPDAFTKLSTLGRTGAVPNFAKNPIQEAIAREVKAGVNPKDIYLDSDPRVKSPTNPMGLLIANRRDEPLGGFQGVQRALKQGIDPKKHGMEIPNFAEFNNLQGTISKNAAVPVPISILPEEAKQLRSVFSKLRTEGVSSIDAFKSINLEIQGLVSGFNLTDESVKIINSKIKKVSEKLISNLASAEQDRRNAEVAAKTEEKAAKRRAEDFVKAKGDLPKQVIPKEGARKKPKELTLDQKAAQILAGQPSPSQSSGFDIKNDPDYRAYLDELDQLDKAKRIDLLKKIVEQRKAEFLAGITSYESPIGPIAPKLPEIIRGGGTGKASAAAFAASQVESSGSSELATETRSIRDAQIRAEEAAVFSNPTFRELALKKQLGGLSNAQLSNLSGTSGDRKGNIANIRDTLSLRSSYAGVADRGVIDKLLGLASSGTLQTDFESTVKGLVIKGKTLSQAYEQASNDLLKGGGTSKQLAKAQLEYAYGLTDFTKEVQSQKAAIKSTISASKLESAISTKGVAGLSRGEGGQLFKTLKNETASKLFGGIDPEVLKADKEAQRIIGIETAKRYRDLRKQALEAVADDAADNFTTSLGTGGGNFFSRFKNDVFSNPLKNAENYIGSNKNLSKGAQAKIRERAKTLAQQRRENLRDRAFSLAFLAPLAAGFIPEGEGGTTKGQVAGGFSGAISGASTGLFLGGALPIPGGALIGAGIGGVAGGITGVVSKLTKSFEELSREVNNVNASYSQQIDAISNYIQVQQKINDAVDAGTSERELSGLISEQFAILQRVRDPNIRASVLGANGDISKISEASSRLTSQAIGVGRAGDIRTAFKAAGEDFNPKNVTDAAFALAAATDRSKESVTKALNEFRSAFDSDPLKAFEKFASNLGLSGKEIKESLDDLDASPDKLKFLFRVFLENTDKFAEDFAKSTENLKRKTREVDIIKITEGLSRAITNQSQLFQANLDSSLSLNRISAESRISSSRLLPEGQIEARAGVLLSENRIRATGRNLAETEGLKAAILDLNKANQGGLKLEPEAKKLLTEISSSNDIDRLIGLIGNGNKDVTSLLQGSKAAIELNNQIASNTEKEIVAQKNADLVRLRIEQKNRVLQGSVFNSDAVASLRNSITGSQVIGGGANNVNSRLSSIENIDALGLPETERTGIIRDSLRRQSGRNLYAQILGDIIGEQVAASDQAISAAVDKVLSKEGVGQEVKDAASRIKLGLEAAAFQPSDLENLSSGKTSSLELASRGSISTDTGVISLGLEKIATKLDPLNAISGKLDKLNEVSQYGSETRDLIERFLTRAKEDNFGEVRIKAQANAEREAKAAGEELRDLNLKLTNILSTREIFTSAKKSNQVSFVDTVLGGEERTRSFANPEIAKLEKEFNKRLEKPGVKISDVLNEIRQGAADIPFEDVNLTKKQIETIVFEATKSVLGDRFNIPKSLSKVEESLGVKTQNLKNISEFGPFLETSLDRVGKPINSAPFRMKGFIKQKDPSFRFFDQDLPGKGSDPVKIQTELTVQKQQQTKATEEQLDSVKETLTFEQGRIKILDSQIAKLKEDSSGYKDLAENSRTRLEVENQILAIRIEQDRVLGKSLGTFTKTLESRFKQLRAEMNDFSDVANNIFDSFEQNAGRAFGDFVTGAKSGKDAFRDFITSVINDAARAFASKAVQGLIGSALGSFNFGGMASGGPVQLASGGTVPALLMGGEYYVSKNSAKAIGRDTLDKLNAGALPKYASGGNVKNFYVAGGSGVKDDVPARLNPGGYVIKKSAVNKYGKDYIDSLAKGRVQKKLAGGVIGGIIGAVAGAGIGYAIGGKKGALIGGALGAAGGAFIGSGGLSGIGNASSGSASVAGNNLSATQAQAGTITQAGFQGAAPVNSFSSLGNGLGDFSNVNAFSGTGGVAAGAATAGTLGFKGIALALGASAVLGIGAQALSKDKKKSTIGPEVKAKDESKFKEGEFAYLQENPQGGVSLVGYGMAPATRRYSMGGEVSYAAVTPYARGYSEGGMVGGGSPMAMTSDIPSSATNVSRTNEGPSVSVTIQINNNGDVSAKSDSKGADGQSGFGPEFAGRLEKQVRGIVRDELVQSSRNGGIAGQVKRSK